MSYDIQLIDPVARERITFTEPHQLRGGTYQVGGSREAWLNITYNYAPTFSRLFGSNGIRAIYGMKASDSISILERAAAQLTDDATTDYWENTEGNVKRAILNLLELARMAPDGIWDGD